MRNARQKTWTQHSSGALGHARHALAAAAQSAVRMHGTCANPKKRRTACTGQAWKYRCVRCRGETARLGAPAARRAARGRRRRHNGQKRATQQARPPVRWAVGVPGAAPASAPAAAFAAAAAAAPTPAAGRCSARTAARDASAARGAGTETAAVPLRSAPRQRRTHTPATGARPARSPGLAASRCCPPVSGEGTDVTVFVDWCRVAHIGHGIVHYAHGTTQPALRAGMGTRVLLCVRARLLLSVQVRGWCARGATRAGGARRCGQTAAPTCAREFAPHAFARPRSLPAPPLCAVQRAEARHRQVSRRDIRCRHRPGFLRQDL